MAIDTGFCRPVYSLSVVSHKPIFPFADEIPNVPASATDSQFKSPFSLIGHRP